MSTNIAQLRRSIGALKTQLQEVDKASSQGYLSASQFSESIGIIPDPWQRKLLESTSRNILLNCSRQSGKSTTIGTLAAHQAIYAPGSQTVIGSPGKRQGNILLRKIKTALSRAGWMAEAGRDNEYELTLRNGSGILVLPGNEATSRGPSAIDLLIMEEAARAKDVLYYALLPMLATRPDAREIHMSTPFGTRGYFYELYRQIKENDGLVTLELDNGETFTDHWDYYEVPAEECPRISKAYLAKMFLRMGWYWFEQEFHCMFQDSITSAFPSKFIDLMVDKEMEGWELSMPA